MTRIETRQKTKTVLKLRNRTLTRHQRTPVLHVAKPATVSVKSKPVSESLVTFKVAPSTKPARSAYSTHKFIEPSSKRLLFVKPKPHASNYHRLLRSLNLTTLRYGAEIRRDPTQSIIQGH